jgi:tetratricopeptide (TPR) repeat protein
MEPDIKHSTRLVILTGLLALGALLRGFYLVEIRNAPDFSSPAVDAGYHDYWARGLVSGNWSTPPFYADPHIDSTPYFRPPGYPYFLAFLYLLLGPGYLAPRIVQMSIGMMSCVLAYLLARKWLGDRTALIAAGLMSVYWSFIYFEGELREPALLVCLLLLMMIVLSAWTEKITGRRCLGAGLLLGLSALVRPNVLPFAAVVLAWLFWILRQRGELRRYRAVAPVFVLGTVLAVAPATIRNYVRGHDLVLISSNGGINLYIGNNKSASGVCASRIEGLGEFRTAYDYPGLVRKLGEKLGRPIRYSEASDYFSSEAVRYAAAHPSRFLQLTGRKALLFWGPREVSNEKEDELARRDSRLLRNLPVRFPLVLSLSILGIALLLSEARIKTARRQLEMAVLVLAFVSVYFLGYLPFFVAGRYRVPVVPFLLLFGAYGIYRIAGFIRKRDLRRSAYCVLAWGIVYTLASVNFAGYEPNAAKWHFDKAWAYTCKGQMDQAVNEYRETLQIDPNDVDAHNNLGNALALQGRLDEAIEHFSQALKLEPDTPSLHVNLGIMLARQGKHSEAMSEFRGAIRIAPDNPAAHNSLVLELYRTGHYREAWNEVRLCRSYGLTLDQSFLTALSQKMPEPAD